MLKSLADWLSYLERLHPSSIDMGLERVARVRDALGQHPAFPIITVTGTNGKGSVCAFLEAALIAAGYRVGCYTSPHLLRYNERVRVNGREADDVLLCQAFTAIEAARGETSLTYFEFGTLAAMQVFLQHSVDVAVLEVGLGGRLDAVNVYDCACAVITSIDLDHAAYLGNTREQVAFEKAGIMRAGRPAVVGETDVPATLFAVAQQTGAYLLLSGRDYSWARSDNGWRLKTPDGVLAGLPLPAMRGHYQVANAAAAIMALWSVRDRQPVDILSLRKGLLEAQVPGRFQVLPGRPVRILDVGHNPHAVRALAANLAQLPPGGTHYAVFAMLNDKDHLAVIRAIMPYIDQWHVAGLAGERGMSGQRLAEKLLQAGVGAQAVHVHADVRQAYQAVSSMAAENDKITTFGSFHTVAEVLACEPGLAATVPNGDHYATASTF